MPCSRGPGTPGKSGGDQELSIVDCGTCPPPPDLDFALSCDLSHNVARDCNVRESHNATREGNALVTHSPTLL